jgi:hypothetical protein
MQLFRPADPTKRRPAWLQNATKENVLAQLAAGVVFLVFLELKDRHEERQLRKKYDRAA